MIEFIKRNLAFISILVLSLFIVWPLFLPGYFFHHDDLQLMRIYEMRRCFQDLQIPCRWVPDMGYGFGYPLYNYYSALPYYIGGILTYPLNYINSAKALFFIPLLLGGISMWFLAKELFGKLGGLSAAILYLFAPYRALDTYVRGAVAESFALAIIPFVFYFSFKLIKKPSKKSFIGLSVSLGAFLTSHNIMTLVFFPILAIWILYLLWSEKMKNYSKLIVSLLLGFGLSAFFLVPAFFEKKLVQSENLIGGGFEFWIHFVSLYQLFLDRAWGYGASIFGMGDTISFQIGWPHWWVIFGLILIALFSLRKKVSLKKILLDQNLQFGILFLLFFLYSIFMTHNKSHDIWETFSIFQYAQFPWRFLGLTIFSVSLLGGLFVASINKKWQLLPAVIIIITTVLFNWMYFKPSDFYFDVKDETKLTGDYWNFQRRASIQDYLPKTAVEPKEPAPAGPEVRTGKASIGNFQNYSNRFSFDAKVLYPAKLVIPVFEFPNWQINVDGKLITHSHDKLGRIQFDLNPGTYKIEGRFTSTPVRTVANLITLISTVCLIGIFFKYKFLKVT